uniref:Reverse transcriptase/retrotransposon-derived protein RNase H-like domain-containing protein n=1 Tax=Lactuca sativa TaxID=4236 RepID=A0A9R1W2N1_LACSA|nr:hypothetical protein LSAT_V11C300108160 [Lactuca sativa]
MHRKEQLPMDSNSGVALQQIKEAFHKLPTLASHVPSETLQVHLLASDEAISSVLVVKREGRQTTVYFISRLVQGPKTNYPIHEKLVLALIYATRCLRHYFQAHQIEVLTNSRNIRAANEMGNQDGGMISAIAHLLARDDQKWTLYTEISSGKEGGEEITYSLRFDFHTSNNEAKYEALLAGLRLAKQMYAKSIVVLTDSRLIPRGENRTADALKKLASTCFDELPKKVLVEVLKERSIDERRVHTLVLTRHTWMSTIVEYLQHDISPDNHK